MADYLDHQRTTGLLVLKNGEIIAEHYRYGRKDDARFLSFSMAKSVTSLLHRQGALAGADRLARRPGREVRQRPGRQPLRRHHSSPAAAHELGLHIQRTLRRQGRPHAPRARRRRARPVRGMPIDVLRSITDRHSPAGEKFVYASAESDVLGRVLTGATGRNIAELTTEWLWQTHGRRARRLLAHLGGRPGAVLWRLQRQPARLGPAGPATGQ
jgi:CubicO group peptidase (beta-lactamase class C family)